MATRSPCTPEKKPRQLKFPPPLSLLLLPLLALVLLVFVFIGNTRNTSAATTAVATAAQFQDSASALKGDEMTAEATLTEKGKALVEAPRIMRRGLTSSTVTVSTFADLYSCATTDGSTCVVDTDIDITSTITISGIDITIMSANSASLSGQGRVQLFEISRPDNGAYYYSFDDDGVPSIISTKVSLFLLLCVWSVCLSSISRVSRLPFLA